MSGYSWWNGVHQDSGINNVSRSSFGSFQATPGNSRRNSFSMDSTETLMPMPDLPPPPPPERSITDLEMKDVSRRNSDLLLPPPNDVNMNVETTTQPSGKSYPAQVTTEHVEHVEPTSSDSPGHRQRMDLES